MAACVRIMVREFVRIRRPANSLLLITTSSFEPYWLPVVAGPALGGQVRLLSHELLVRGSRPRPNPWLRVPTTMIAMRATATPAVAIAHRRLCGSQRPAVMASPH